MKDSSQALKENLAVKEKKDSRLLVFIVAYNAENTIESVVRRIPQELSQKYNIEVLIIDDASKDRTFVKGQLLKQSGSLPFEITVLFNPVNQGYGGNQKIGFHYALENGFDWVALVHGDGQYAPECLPELIVPLIEGQADAVFGSRMMQGNSALKGGMPLYKFVGNKILTGFQNYLLQSQLSEFHSGYRLYSTEALGKIPFGLNSNDFHFDTEIIIQLFISGQRIKELPIPTYYGTEICHVNGLKYAWDVCAATLQSRVQKYHIFYDRKYDCKASQETNEIAVQPFSPEAVFLSDINEAKNVCVIGNTSQVFVNSCKQRNHQIKVETREFLSLPDNALDGTDYVLFLDGEEISRHPERFVEKISDLCKFNTTTTIIIAVGNVGFIVSRLLLLLGRFSYTKKGILSLSHARLFTLRSLRKLFSQSGFSCELQRGLPIQYSKVFSWRPLAKIFELIHSGLIKIRPSLFSYQLVVAVKPEPSLDYLLQSAIHTSQEKSKEFLVG